MKLLIFVFPYIGKKQKFSTTPKAEEAEQEVEEVDRKEKEEEKEIGKADSAKVGQGVVKRVKSQGSEDIYVPETQDVLVPNSQGNESY